MLVKMFCFFLCTPHVFFEVKCAPLCISYEINRARTLNVIVLFVKMNRNTFIICLSVFYEISIFKGVGPTCYIYICWAVQDMFFLSVSDVRFNFYRCGIYNIFEFIQDVSGFSELALTNLCAPLYYTDMPAPICDHSKYLLII